MRSKIAMVLVVVLLFQSVYVPRTYANEISTMSEQASQQQVVTTTPPGIGVEKPEEVSQNVFDYGLFAGNPRANLEFSGYTLDVDGNVRSNNGIRTNCRDLTITGSCEATGLMQLYGSQIKIGQQVTGVPNIQMPHFYDEITASFKNIADVYEGDLVVNESHVNFKMPAIIRGDATFNNRVLEGTGAIFADRHITLNMHTLSSQNNSRVFYYSKEGNITINAAYAKLNGIIYAPNGTVTFNGYDLELNGRIIADRVILNGSLIKIKTAPSDLELLNKPPVVEAGNNQEVNLINKVQLDGLVQDDQLVYTTPQIQWQKVDGPGVVTFENRNQASTQASFSEVGDYLLELSAFDGQYTRKDRVSIRVISKQHMIYKTYTSTEDFAEGKMINLTSTVPNQLQLDEDTKPFNFIWVAVSSKGTVVKIDTDTGEVLGEYRTAPQGQALNPSRTTVDKKGNVWVANRNGNSVTRIGLEENGQWIDKNGNGVCDTSTGLGNVLDWTNAGGADTNGGVSTAEDECIITYVRTSSSGTRHVSVDGNNDVWVSGTGGRVFDLIDGDTGEIKRREGSVGYGGYGGLIDENGVIWSARPFLRWDTATPLSQSEYGKGWTTSNHDSYGLAIDPQGNVWDTSHTGNIINKFAPDGKRIGTYNHGSYYAQGAASDQNGDIWVAHSIYTNTIGRLKNDGTWIGNIALPSGPTGVAVDANNKIWATCMNAGVVVRIDPTKGRIGADGKTPIGEIDYTSPYLGGTLYNYSDMTGSTLYGMPELGTWTTVYDSQTAGVEWGKIVWNGQRTNDGSIRVYVETSEDGVTFSKQQEITNGSQISLPPGRYIKLNVEFRRSSDGKTPILTDITVTSKGNEIPLKANDVPEIIVDSYLTTNMTQSLDLKAVITDDLLPTSDPMSIGWIKVSGPGEVTFENATKAVTTAQFTEEGTYTLALQATDGMNQREKIVKVDVTKTPIIVDEEPPVIDLLLSKEVAPVGEDVVATISATDNMAISDLKIWINGEAQVLEQQLQPYEMVLKGDVPKIYHIEVKAVDTSGNESYKEVTCKIINAEDTTKPIVAITKPASGSHIDQVVEVIGTAMDVEGLLHYELQYQKKGAEQQGFTTFVKETVPCDNRSLGILDPSQLEVGTYTIRLIAYDKGGNSSYVDVEYHIEEMVADILPPQIAIMMSKDKANVGELVEASIEVSDNRGLQSISIYKDDVLVEEIKDLAEGTIKQTATLSFSEVDTKIVKVKVVATDINGNTGQQIGECSIVDNRDRMPPTVNLSIPTHASYIGGNVGFSGTVQDEMAIERYLLQVKGADEGEEKFVTLFEGNDQKIDQVFGVWDSRKVKDGTYDFRLTAQDKGGNSAYEQIQCRVDNTAPTAAITFSKSQASVGEQVVATIEVADNISLDKVAVYANDVLKLEGPGTITFVSSQPETITVRVVATDKSGNVIETSKACNMIDNRDPEGPLVDIQTPIHGSKITQPTKIVGTVRDHVGIKDYKLEYRLKDTSEYTLLAEGNTEKLSEVLAVFDPTNLQKGIYEMRLTATDISGWESYISIFYDVTDGNGQGNENLTLVLEVSQISAIVGEQVEAHVYTQGTAEVAKLELYIDGVLTPTVNGKVNFTSEEARIVKLSAVAETVKGSKVLVANECQFVVEQGQGQSDAIIKLPEVGTSITAPTEIIGTAKDDVAFASYKLQYKKTTDTEYITFVEDVVPKTDEVLGVFDPTLLENGSYNVRLVVTDQAGNMTITETHYVVEGEMKIGHMSIGFTDITANVAGITMSVDRFYDSRNKSMGDFGVGWRLGLNNMQLFESTPMAHGWEQVQGGSGLGTYYQIVDTGKHYVTVNLGDGTSKTFDVVLGASQQPFVPIRTTTVNFKERGNSGYKLEVVGSNNVLLSQTIGETDFIGDATSFFFEPVRYKLTTKEGTEIIIHKVNGVESMKDSNGNTVTITKEGVIHSGGKSILFERDTQDRIIKATDPAGKVTTYTYDDKGDLVAVTNPLGQTVRFIYAQNHFLQEIIGPDGKPVARNEYDVNGRLIATIDASGNRMEFNNDIEGRRQVVRDRLGNQEVYTYDDKGKVIHKVDKEGATVSMTYNDDGKLTSFTNPNNHTSYYEYDQNGNLTKIIDKNNQTMEYTYNQFGQVLSEKDGSGHTVVRTYDDRGNLTSETDKNNNKMNYKYNEKGNLAEVIDFSGKVLKYIYDQYGNVITEDDYYGNKIHYTYDANGNKLTEEKNGLITQYGYDGLGRISSVIDPKGNVTKFEYDAYGREVAVSTEQGTLRKVYDDSGNIIEIQYPDGTKEQATYDLEGRKLAKTNREGHTTYYTYSKGGKLTKTTYPDGTVEERTYNAVGQLATYIDQNNNKTVYTYDPEGRLIEEKDALGYIQKYTYDAVGNRVTMTDKNGHTTRYTYDANGMLTQMIYPNGLTKNYVYDHRFNVVKETNEEGIAIQYEYDQNNNLTKVIDGLSHVTTYTYDNSGNMLSYTDANKYTTQYAYDGFGRKVKTILPTGAEENFTYDSNGNVLKHKTFNGEEIKFTYNQLGQLVAKEVPGRAKETYTYTVLGKLETVVNEQGTASYVYDKMGRLIKTQDFNGFEIHYRYDDIGNLANISSALGETSYTYDQLNRLSKAVTADGEIVEYSYDGVGNRTGMTYNGGIQTSYQYDTLSRLVGLNSKKTNGEVIINEEYTLSPTGNRTKIVNHLGEERLYNYDHMSKLLEEVYATNGQESRKISYTYDAAGNRLSKNENSSISHYVYDANNQLLSEGNNTYTYDSNGNMVSSLINGETTLYHYDAENRLNRVDGTHQISYTYDHNNIRNSVTTNGQTTHFMVDSNTVYPRVIGETNELGQVVSRYVYGDELIAQEREGNKSYYIRDGKQSIVALTNTNQEVTDTYKYDAFGNLLEQTGSTPNDFLYTGQQYDQELEMYYLRQRYMMPQTGRFISRDSWEGDAKEPYTLHKYAYVSNNPVNFYDPQGLWKEPVIKGILAHMWIEGKYRMEHPSNQVNVGRIGGYIPGVPGRVYGGYADIIDYTANELYEIKTRKQFDAGIQQLLDYMKALDAWDESKNKVILGVTWPGMPRAEAWPLGGVIVYSREAPGLIIYDVQNFGDPDAYKYHSFAVLRRPEFRYGMESAGIVGVAALLHTLMPGIIATVNRVNQMRLRTIVPIGGFGLVF